jgi:thiol-disulfide isomerase/thioredoxin
MNRLFVLLLIVIVAVSCNRKGSKIVIKGELGNAKGQVLCLQELTVKGDGKIDSIILDKSGKFKISKTINYPSFYNLWVDKGRPVTIVALPKERIKLQGVADSLYQTYSVEGSEESERAQILNRMLDNTVHKLDSLNKVYQLFLNNPNIAQIEQTLQNNYNRFVDEQREFTIMFIEKDINSFANIIALYQQINANTFIMYQDDDLKYFEKVHSALRKKYPESPYIGVLSDNINQMQQQKSKLKVQQMISELGAVAPEIALPTPYGDTVKLSTYKGKYVLVEFWASWSAPCRIENRDLVPIYKKFKPKGFEIYQVSLDKTRDAWITAIREDGCSWINVSNLKFWDSPAARSYAVESVPSSFLLDKDGTIMSKNLKSEALYSRLAQLLGE